MHENFISFLVEEEKRAEKSTFDPTVFYVDINGKMKMRDSVWKHLVHAADSIDELIPIYGAYVIGDICTKKYNDDTPIKMAILLDKDDMDDVLREKLVEAAEKTAQGLVSDTRHPLRIDIRLVDGLEGKKRWIMNQPYAFDVHKNAWLKMFRPVKENLSSIKNFIISNEPNDLVFLTKENPVSSDMFFRFSSGAVEAIKMWVKNKIFDLLREANGVATTPEEKRMVKDILNNHGLDMDRLQTKFVENDISEQIAINLLKQNYYYEILDSISEAKSNRSIETEFSDELTKVSNRSTNEAAEIFRHPSFNEFILTEDKKHIKKLKALKNLVDPGKAGKSASRNKYKSHDNRALNDRRSLTSKIAQYRKYLDLTRSPVEEISDEFSCKSIIQRAKDVPKGFWPVNLMQAKWIASVYHFDMPNRKDRIKRLSNMDMALFKPRRGKMFFLVKDPRLTGIS